MLNNTAPTTIKPVNLANLPVERFKINGMVYGSNGVGKTIFCCSSQRMRTFLIDVDRGCVSARCWRGYNDGQIQYPGVRTDLVTVQPVTTWDEFNQAVNYAVAYAGTYFDLIVVDTATEVQRLVIRELCRREKIEVASQREWGISLSMLEEIASTFRSCNAHVLFTAHEMEKEDEHERRIMFMPAFQGQFKAIYGKHFSLIMRYVLTNSYSVDQQTKLQVVSTYRALQCQRDQYSHAKDRSTGLDKWEPPVLDYIFGKFLARIQEPANTQESSQQHGAEKALSAAAA